MKIANTPAISFLPFSAGTLIEAIEKTNAYLVKLPSEFKLDGKSFYTILNQRNLSGFVGEILKHAIAALDARFCANPHPDGRPDLLNLTQEHVKAHFLAECFEAVTKAPLRTKLAPFQHGGVEIKCTIGKLNNASEKPIGDPRVSEVTGLTYWAHHAHDCDLLGIYYDFCGECDGSPQIKAAFFTNITQADWHKVSVGDPNKKKTSNTSLRGSGIAKVYSSLVVYDDSGVYMKLMDRLGIAR